MTSVFHSDILSLITDIFSHFSEDAKNNLPIRQRVTKVL